MYRGGAPGGQLATPPIGCYTTDQTKLTKTRKRIQDQTATQKLRREKGHIDPNIDRQESELDKYTR